MSNKFENSQPESWVVLIRGSSSALPRKLGNGKTKNTPYPELGSFLHPSIMETKIRFLTSYLVIESLKGAANVRRTQEWRLLFKPDL